MVLTSYLDRRSSLVVCSVRLVGRVGQAGQPADVAPGAETLRVADGVPGNERLGFRCDESKLLLSYH